MLTAASTRDQGSAAVTTLNHQFRLAARPVGLPKTQRLELHRRARARAERRRSAGEDRVPLARSRDARLDERRQVVHRAGADRRSDARGRRRRSGRVAASWIQTGRPRLRHRRHPGVRDRRRQDPDESRFAPRAAAGVSRHVGHAGHDRVLRPARCRQAAAGPDGRRLRRGRRGGHGRRADREDQRLSRSRASPAAARSATTSCASSASMPQSTTSPTT